MIYVIPESHFSEVVKHLGADVSKLWAVGCGCDSHGDHAACESYCSDLGCAHPKGYLVVASSEQASDRYRAVPAEQIPSAQLRIFETFVKVRVKEVPYLP